MRRFRFRLYWTLAFFLLQGCGGWEAGLPDHLLARIDGEEITVDEFNREFKEQFSLQREGENPATLKALREAYLDQMIERKVLAREARRLGLRVSAEELTQSLLEIKKDYPGEGFGEKLSLMGMSLEDWKTRLEEKLLAEKMLRSSHFHEEEIDERSLRDFYEANRSLFILPERVRARQIVVTDGSEAIQILNRLKKGESFEKLAKEKSLGPEKAQGGDLGYFSQGERPAEFDPVFSLKVGAVSEIIQSPYGYHIFKLEEKTEPREISFEEARKGIVKRLQQERSEEAYQRWLKNIKAKTKVRVNRKWLAS